MIFIISALVMLNSSPGINFPLLLATGDPLSAYSRLNLSLYGEKYNILARRFNTKIFSATDFVLCMTGTQGLVAIAVLSATFSPQHLH
ncbi:MAG: hypothetical protein CSA11_12460 [Chloroflexi bacterium]|nr:MAG: hypothetical protein CSA11_12460 [Chloroflexota bacterium]